MITVCYSKFVKSYRSFLPILPLTYLNFLVEINHEKCDGCENERKKHHEGLDSDFFDYHESTNTTFDPGFGNRSRTFDNETSEYYDTMDRNEYDDRGYEGIIDTGMVKVND